MEKTKKEEQLLIDLGVRISTLRSAKGLTQEMFSSASGMDRSALAKIETGRVNPTIIVLKRIADSLDIELDQLLVLED